jgi:prefoldin subunit 5
MATTFTWSKDLHDTVALIQSQITIIQGQITQLQTDMAAMQASIPQFPDSATTGVPYELVGVKT